MSVDIKYLIEKRNTLKERKQPWEYPFQILGKYIYTKKQQFQQEVEEGSFLNDGMINDSTAVRANGAMTSAIMGALWKSGGRTFRIRRPRHIPNSKLNNDFYLAQNQVLAEAMEAPHAGFETAFHEELSEEGAFGTSAIALFKGDYENPLIFKSWSIQNLMIAEGPDGFVDTVYYDMSMSLRTLVATYGKDKLPADLKKIAEDPTQQTNKIKVCVAIEPRASYDKTKSDELNMPIRTCHFLFEDPQAILKESGFTEMPVRIGRWYKLANEEYGRSPGMDALPAIMQLNALKESFLVCVEKKAEPPLYILDDGSLGAGTVDTSARGLSVFNSFGRAPGQPPIGQLFDVGELQSITTAISETKEEILGHFLIDRLYDLNNKSRMTLGEAEMRYQIRSDALSSIYARKTSEILNPLIVRAYNILFSMGLLGIKEDDKALRTILESNGIDPIIIPPDIANAIIANKVIFEVDYISPAAHVMREEELRGIMTTVDTAVGIAAVDPTVMDGLNKDKVLQYTKELTGAPADILFSADEIAAARSQRQKTQSAAQQAMLAESQSKTVKNLAGANKDVATAGGAQ